jgi:mannose-6-phosphate isomerase-like protein (cupin superfamily)
MKRTAILAAVLAIVLADICLAQANPQAGASQQPPGGAAAGNAQRPALVGSNEVTGVDIDRFIGYPENAPVHLSHGTLLTHSILRAGDPYKPGLQGAVLEYRKDISVATLLGMNKTPLSTLPDEFFFYVESGTGRLDDGKQYWDLREGIALLVPPNAPHRFTNASNDPLKMVMLTWTAAGTPKPEILVRDVNLLGYCEENAHWNNTSKCIFSAADGLFQNERMYLVMLQPWAVNQPHSHGKGTEEIWTKVTPGTIPILMGSELREMHENTAYLVPPDGLTEHANLNISKDRVEWWLYVARGAAPAPGEAARGAGQGRGAAAGAAGAGRGAGRPPNPNLTRDATEATIAGKPIK